MKIFKFIVPFILLIGLTILLSIRIKEVPAFGNLLNPYWGVWQNAINNKIPQKYNTKQEGLNEPVSVIFDSNNTPHIIGNNAADVYYMQGYLTAKERLWQMEISTMATAGRLSEVLGAKTLDFDKKQRRKGLTWAAENCLVEVLKDSKSKLMVDQYTAGVNAFINSLNYKDLPVEYKLLNYEPEPWTTLKCVLLLKAMADDLSGRSNDFNYTTAINKLGPAMFESLFPDFPTYISPIIPIGTKFNLPKLKRNYYDTLSNNIDTLIRPEPTKPELPNGSNNWAVNGNKTKSGAPILCGDPHLKLSLPSIWFEIQLTIGNKNVNGASLPGAPGIIIGFNDSCAWSMTNAERDVKDFYKIEFKDANQNEYLYDSVWVKTKTRIEEIKIKNEATYYDTVFYTVQGPVMYDKNFEAEKGNLAMAWIAHQPSNEFKTIYLLNEANNLNDYENALSNYCSPAQNFVFATKNNDIAIWQQGKFVTLAVNQGKFIEAGNVSSNTWLNYIPFTQNPHIINPIQNYVSSANQQPTDASYPFNYYGDYYTYRSLRLNSKLDYMQNITINDMMQLQNDNYNLWVTDFKNAILKNTSLKLLQESPLAKKYLPNAWQWNQENTSNNQYTIFYKLWYDNICNNIFSDEWQYHKMEIDYPNRDVLLKLNMMDSTFLLVDDINTPKKEVWADLILKSLITTLTSYDSLVAINKQGWAINRNTTIAHLAKIDAFSQKVNGDGESNSLNAISSTNGPSWRMIVSLTGVTEAYGIFPGGQSGHVGSKFYNNRIARWEQGKYDKIYTLNNSNTTYQKIIFTP
jgi:penicillin amidase